MWAHLLNKSEAQLAEEFIGDFFNGRLAAALSIAALGDSKGFGIHTHRYNARRALIALLSEVTRWRRDNDAKMPRAGCALDFIVSLAALKLMLHIGQLSFDCMETLDGYKHVDIARAHLEAMQLSGKALTAEQLEGIPAELAARAAQHSAGKPQCLSDAAKARSRVSLCGSGILMEMYVFQAVAWSRWGDTDHAMLFLEANEHLKRLWDLRQLEHAKHQRQQVVASLVMTAEAEAERARDLMASDAETQRAALERRLQARRAAKSGSGKPGGDVLDASPSTPPASAGEQSVKSPQESSPPAAQEAPAPTFSTAAGLLRDLPALEWAFFPAFSGDVLHTLNFCGLEGRDAIDLLASKAASCSAQVLKSQQSMIKSSFYCHTSLVERAKSLFTSDVAVAREWVTACMSLAEWYLLVMDLSHAEHCLAAIAEIAKRAQGSLAVDLFGTDETLRVGFHFFSATLAYLTMKLAQATAASYEGPFEVVFAQMFLNPVLEPEEFRNVPDEKKPATPNWSFPERLPFPLPGLPPPRKELVVRADGLSDMLALHGKLTTHLDAIREQISVNNDCERYLESTRMEADAFDVLYDFSEDPMFLRHRIAILQRIYDVGLNPNAFRNVLRQADYDCGSSAKQIGDLYAAAAKAEEASGQDSATSRAAMTVNYEGALRYFTNFTACFHREVAQAAAQGKGIRDVLDASDFPALLLGEMHCASLLLKVGKRSEAILKYEFIIRFFNEHPEVMRQYPDTREQKEQCAQILELLGGRVPTGTSRRDTSPPPAPAGGRAAPQQQRLAKQAMEPSTRVVIRPRGKK